MDAPLPVTLRWLSFALYCIVWLLLWIATGSNSYLRSSLTTRFNFGSNLQGAYSIPITLGAFEVCAHIDVLAYDLTYMYSADTDCARIPSGCVTDVYPFGENDVPLPLNYRNTCSTFHAFQSFLILAGLECTLLPFFLFLQLMAHKLAWAQWFVDRFSPGGLYRTGIAISVVVFVTGVLSLVCMPTAVDDNWAQVCADILTYNPGSGGGGFDLCQAPKADYGASFDCHVTAMVLVAIALVCYVVAWVQETKMSVAGSAYTEQLHVNHSDAYDGGI